MTDHFPAPWRVCPYALHIYADNVPKGPVRVADLRGWGYLTGKGHSALGLSDDEGIKVQKANAAFIVKAVNSHERMFEALMEIRRIANEPGDRRALVDKIYGIATEACRIPSAVSSGKEQ